MKKLSVSTLAFAATLMTAPFTSAHADPVPGYYLGLGAMGNQTTDSNAHFTGNQNRLSYDLGYGLEGSGGYAFNNGFRLEGEVAHLRAQVDKVRDVSNGSGTLAYTDLTGNLFYDFRTGTLLTPYVGAGLGLGIADAQNMGTLSNGGTMKDSQLVFVYQAVVGIAAQLDKNWAVTADYRYIASTDPRFTTSGGPNTTIDYSSHNIVVGVRYSFGHPEAPVAQPVTSPKMAAAPTQKPVVAAVPQSYMVFFDFNKSELTPEAKRILASAAQDFRNGGYVRIVVTGHTDTVGTAGYNQKLSERRAASVKAEMEHLGVGETAVVTSGVGKNGLLVPTANGVREAQNRRAEIVFDKQ